MIFTNFQSFLNEENTYEKFEHFHCVEIESRKSCLETNMPAGYHHIFWVIMIYDHKIL